jgi:hypothetical protein
MVFYVKVVDWKRLFKATGGGGEMGGKRWETGGGRQAAKR